jgi:hypothetical protein
MGIWQVAEEFAVSRIARGNNVERLMTRLFRGLLSVCLLLVVCSPSVASIRYTYTGNQLVTTSGGGPASLSRITFTMTGDLGINRELDIRDDPTPSERFSPTSWSISDGVNTFSSTPLPPNLNSYFLFSTNSAGEIINWYVQIPTYNSVTLISYLLRTSNSPTLGGAPNGPPSIYDQSRQCSAISCDFTGVTDYDAFAYGQPGFWTMTTDVDHAGTLALLAIGLAGVGFFRRKNHFGARALGT